MHAWILARACGDFNREQAKGGHVFVRASRRTVAPEETGARAFLATEATGSVEEPGCKPFEADGLFPKPATEAGNDAIDETTADKRFANDCACRPLRAVDKEITDG